MAAWVAVICGASPRSPGSFPVALDPVFVDYTLPERHFAKVKVGQRVKVQVQAYPDRTFEGANLAENAGEALHEIENVSAYIADISSREEKAARFGLIGAGFGVGFVLGPALGGGTLRVPGLSERVERLGRCVGRLAHRVEDLRHVGVERPSQDLLGGHGVLARLGGREGAAVHAQRW